MSESQPSLTDGGATLTKPAPDRGKRRAGRGDPAPKVKLGAARWWREVGWRHVVGVIAVVWALFPVSYLVSASLNPLGNVVTSTLIPQQFSLTNFTKLLDEQPFGTWARNSLIVCVCVVFVQLLFSALAAYAFSRFRFTGRRTGLTTLLIIQMFPQMLAFIAIFLLLIALGNVVPVLGVDSKLALICVYLGGALGSNTFLMYGFFNTIPREIDEAAKIDGATHSQTYWTIILRLVTPILAVVALLSFIAHFGEFILARIILTSESNWTLAVGMYAWVSDQLNANWGLFAAGAVVAAVPILALFLFLQKYIVSGLTSGSVKG